MSSTIRNYPCPCGSGKMYNKCCLPKTATCVSTSLNWHRIRRTESQLEPLLLDHLKSFYGKDSVAEAWDEFSMWNDIPMNIDSEPELDSIFLPWMLYNWHPDNSDRGKAAHLPEVPVAQHYLKFKRLNLDSCQRAFIKEACSQAYSFFLVTRVVPDKQLHLRDLMLEQDVVVHERHATNCVQTGQILFTRVITLDGDSVMLGCAPYSIAATLTRSIIEFRERIAAHLANESNRRIQRDTLHEYDIELRDIYYSLREQIANPDPPQLVNTDGDILQLTKHNYQLKCSISEAVPDLLSLAMEKNLAKLLKRGKFNKKGELISIEFPWLKSASRKKPGWKNMVLGQIVIIGNKLTVEVNSQERANSIHRKIKYRLGRKIEFVNTEIQTIGDLADNNDITEEGYYSFEDYSDKNDDGQPQSNTEHEELVTNPEVMAIVQNMANKHWQAWTDTPLPALDFQTPRQAVKTKLGRERLEIILLSFEGRSMPGDHFAPDVKSLRNDLGL